MDRIDEIAIFNRTIAQLIRELRGDMSQEVLSIKSGVSRITIGKWENIKRTPSSYELYKVINALCPENSEFWKLFQDKYGPLVREMNLVADRAKIPYNASKKGAKSKHRPDK